ncbi:LPS-assembly protein LptD [Bdellovibrio sp. HCB337]|uniref:LPS-assembly protein LptD n=1 Tax=Bdellovibrio sp. HCB337 TaxID=3394358 RepID=UPI0039A51171
MFFTLGFLLSGNSFAQSSARIQDVLLNADSSFRDTENETMELEGNVQIVFQNQHIKADKAKVNFRTRQAELTGHVEISTQKNIIGGTAATLDYENNTGIIYNGFVQSGPVVFSGAVLQKVSEDEFYVTQADYTTCTNCPATWGFSGSNIRAELGGYAYIKNSILKIYAVPVFWLPYLIVPLKSDRQTGLLTPRILGDGAGGLAISESYFWAISRSTDATFTLTNYEKRGLKALAEYRYVLNPLSYGNLNTAFIVDRVFKNDSRVTTFQTPEEKGSDINRWFARYDHYYDMPSEYTQRAQINVASDLQYPKDFPEETLNHGDPAMDNRFSLTKNSFDQHFSVDSSYYINMLQSNPLATNTNAVHRFPEIRFSQAQQKIANSQFLYSYHLNYMNFARAGQSFDNLSNNGTVRFPTNTCGNPDYDKDPTCKLNQDGTFNPTEDLIRTGQRFDATGVVYRPFTMGGYADILPAISYRETQYLFNIEEDRHNVRRYARATVSAKTTLSRIFEDAEGGPKTDKYKHDFQPEIIATAIPWLDHAKHPFFGSASEPDGTFYYSDTLTDSATESPYGIQFDYHDRVYDRGLITFVLTNKVTQKKWLGDNPQYLQIVNFKLFQSYDTYQANLKNPTRDPWSDLYAVLDMRLRQFQTYTTLTYLPDVQVTNISSRIRLSNDYGQFFQLQLTKTYDREAQDIARSRVEDYTFAAGFTSGPLNLMGKVVYDANWANNNRKKIKSWAYVAQLKPPGECWMINITQYLPTGGDTKTFLDFVFSFDGVPKPTLPPETLDLYGF